MSDLPIIAGVEITTDAEGRFSLNALHRASGLGDHKRPSEWLSTKQAQELIKELEKSQSGNPRFDVINVIKGGNAPGTFAHKLLAISYAGWISPSFQLQVNQVFLDHKTARPQTSEPKRMLPTDALLSIPSYMESIKLLFPNLGQTSVQEIVGSAINRAVDYPMLPLPKIEEKFYTATEIADENGVSAQKVGRIATAFGLKTEEYGEYRLSKSKHSSTQVEQFYYNEKGRQALAMLFAETVEIN